MISFNSTASRYNFMFANIKYFIRHKDSTFLSLSRSSYTLSFHRPLLPSSFRNLRIPVKSTNKGVLSNPFRSWGSESFESSHLLLFLSKAEYCGWTKPLSTFGRRPLFASRSFQGCANVLLFCSGYWKKRLLKRAFSFFLSLQKYGVRRSFFVPAIASRGRLAHRLFSSFGQGHQHFRPNLFFLSSAHSWAGHALCSQGIRNPSSSFERNYHKRKIPHLSNGSASRFLLYFLSRKRYSFHLFSRSPFWVSDVRFRKRKRRVRNL